MELHQIAAELGEQAYTKFLELRKVRPATVRFEGKTLSDEKPGWLVTAEFIVGGFCGNPLWLYSPGIIALCQQAVSDLSKSEEFEFQRGEVRDRAYCVRMRELRSQIVHYLKSNGISES